MIVALAAAVFLTWYNFRNTTALSHTIENLQKPDTRISDLNLLVLNVNNAESDVRSFAITRNKDYLASYYNMVSASDSQMIHLKSLFAGYEKEFDDISKSVKKKFELYDELIDLRYRQLINEAMSKISGNVKDIVIPADSDSVAATKQSFFKRLFSSGKRMRELEEKAILLDSLNELQTQKLSSIKKTVAAAQENEVKQISILSEKELLLLEQDKALKEQLQEQVNNLEGKIRINNEIQSQKVVYDSRQQMQTVMAVTLFASVFILLLSIIILTGISRANRYKTELEKAKAKSEQLAKFKEDFLASMSHEIRTPLSAITGFTKRLLNTSATSEQKQYIRTIDMAGDHLLNIVNDVLDLSRIETGKLQLKNENFSVAALVNDVYSMLSQKASEKHINFTADTTSVMRDVVEGDPLRLRQILINIVANAIKFTNEGSVHLMVTKPEKDKYSFKVSDTGIGIPEEKLQRIFNPYEQADNIEKNYGGTGLGLAITGKITELLHGDIAIESRLQKGTVITVTIPYRQVETADAHTTVSKQEEKYLLNENILIAEDDDLNRELAIASLKEAGADVITAHNGKEAIEKILLNNPVAVLMDVQMPEMNGRQAVMFIREHISKTLPVIGITANMMNDARQECADAGMNEVLLKPFDTKQLATILMPLIERYKEQSALVTDVFSFNLSSLYKTSNGKSDFVIKMLKIFVSSNTKLFDNTLRFTEEEKYAEAAAHLHRMIPSFRQLELDHFTKIFKNLEWLLLEGSDKKATLAVLNDCKIMFDKLILTIEQKITSLEAAV
ncbi:MAG TPA: ATP-binding protein [Bacteroidia bacterium]|nr:MAG: multi-sensor hybrid histidine kinase [Bacteroidetes bacterium OLB10]MCB8931627.1 response regulator [Bacteroidia bacterium]MCO5288557.1 ATP-binding protein [Bacteroidota bacterium]OQB60783.1 MAG: Aerobic respiration control sensor protein ArcB [Bacteroidetes bacterium ADurb.Bin141]MCW5931817.1 response regulator [Bacteroidota bacterium]